MGAEKFTTAKINNIETRRSRLTVEELLILAAALRVPPLELLAPLALDIEIDVAPGVTSAPWALAGWVIGDTNYPGLEGSADEDQYHADFSRSAQWQLRLRSLFQAFASYRRWTRWDPHQPDELPTLVKTAAAVRRNDDLDQDAWAAAFEDSQRRRRQLERDQNEWLSRALDVWAAHQVLQGQVPILPDLPSEFQEGLRKLTGMDDRDLVEIEASGDTVVAAVRQIWDRRTQFLREITEDGDGER